MSNSVVGGVYQSIIEDVINTSRVDFEENGVEESVLEDLCQGWKKKLSQFNVAQFPWDPKPESEQLLADPVGLVAGDAGVGVSAGSLQSPAAPANTDAGFPQNTMSPMNMSQGLPMPLPMPSMDSVKTDDLNSGIKLEPGLNNGMDQGGIMGTSQVGGPMPTYPGLPMGSGNAAARAAQQLQNTFGQRAAASINALNSSMNQGNRQQQAQPAMNAQQYRAQMAAQNNAQQLNGANGVARSQVDGADGSDDKQTSIFEGVLMQQQTAGQPPVELGRVDIDNLLHEQIALRAKEIEGGGLMIPLKEAMKQRKGNTSRRSRKVGGVPQTDGMDDEEDIKEDLDDDAINSDLDDPDEAKDDDDDDDDVLAPIMLCVYDKVQRVKNKWKCTLKDGVLTVNGKEYVFHKATGEYEW